MLRKLFAVAFAIACLAGLPAYADTVQNFDCSGTIAVGGTAQNLSLSTNEKKGFQIQNLDTTEPLWINFNTTAVANTAGSYALAAATSTSLQNGGSYYSPVAFITSISVVAATGGHKFSCTYWR